MDAGSLYVDLVKRSVGGLLARGRRDEETVPREAWDTGYGWPATYPSNVDTMIGLRRLDNLVDCVETVLRDRVPGDLIETGVWRGGATILMRAILAARGDRKRRVYVADSFRGLPPPNVADYPQDEGLDLSTEPQLAVSLDEVVANFDRYGLLDEQVQFLEGWFKDTLPTVKDRTWAVIRLDGDLYESTMDALTNLYAGLSPGGFVIVDDYGAYQSCRQAVHDFRDRNGITEEIRHIDWTGACWRRDG